MLLVVVILLLCGHGTSTAPHPHQLDYHCHIADDEKHHGDVRVEGCHHPGMYCTHEYVIVWVDVTFTVHIMGPGYKVVAVDDCDGEWYHTGYDLKYRIVVVKHDDVYILNITLVFLTIIIV